MEESDSDSAGASMESFVEGVSETSTAEDADAYLDSVGLELAEDLRTGIREK